MIIDFRARLPFKEQFSDIDPKDRSTALPHWMSHYVEVYGDRLKESIDIMDTDLLLKSMDEAGVDIAVVQAEWEFGDHKALNEKVYKIMNDHPKKILGMCTVHPEDSIDMAKEAREWIEKGMRGVNLQPWAYRMEAHDRRFYPVYETCLEMGVPVTIHTAINFTATRSMIYGKPINLDIIACDFPELTIVASHGGWPWVNEMVAVAWKHKNVYIETWAVSPKYMPRPGSGWEPLLLYGNSILKEQLLFATEWPMLPFERVIFETRELPLKPEVIDNYLGGNAKRLLGL